MLWSENERKWEQTQASEFAHLIRSAPLLCRDCRDKRRCQTWRYQILYFQDTETDSVFATEHIHTHTHTHTHWSQRHLLCLLLAMESDWPSLVPNLPSLRVIRSWLTSIRDGLLKPRVNQTTTKKHKTSTSSFEKQDTRQLIGAGEVVQWLALFKSQHRKQECRWKLKCCLGTLLLILLCV